MMMMMMMMVVVAEVEPGFPGSGFLTRHPTQPDGF